MRKICLRPCFASKDVWGIATSIARYEKTFCCLCCWASKGPLPRAGPECDCGRRDTIANANTNFDAPRKFARIFTTKSQTKSCELCVAKEFASDANGFANEIAKISSLLWNFLANGSLRQNFRWPRAVAYFTA